MITVRYAVCSERDNKPVTRAIVDSRSEADRVLERLRQADLASPEASYWIAELGPECEAWRWLISESASG
jgi:hypothetical protein